jgi:hypothetical protein
MNSKTNEEKYAVPQSESMDILYAAGEALSNFIPFAGPDLFRLVFTSPLETRRNKWMEEVGKALLDLHNKKIVEIHSLAKNEEFVTIATEVTKVALAQHEEEKLHYLKNAILNSLLQDLKYDIKYSFIRAVEQLTPRHVQILRWLKPQSPGQVKVIVGRDNIVKELALSHFDGMEEVAAVFFEDLCQYRFIEKEIFNYSSHMMERYTFKNWGVMFLEFIDSPNLKHTKES